MRSTTDPDSRASPPKADKKAIVTTVSTDTRKTDTLIVESEPRKRTNLYHQQATEKYEAGFC